MGTSRNPRLLILIAGAVLVVVVAALAALMFKARDKEPDTPPPASTGGLVVQTGQADSGKLDSQKSLRCFVHGQFDGVETLAECARKNGVATESLDVGMDKTGALAAVNGGGSSLAPLPPGAAQAAAPPDAAVAAAAPQVRAPVADCQRFASGVWRKIGTAMPLTACVQALFSGVCLPPGETESGQWGGNALRLTERRVEMSDDGVSFRALVDQSDGCAISQF